MIRSLRAGLMGGALLLSLAVPAAQAHSPYLLPTVFDASDRKIVTVEGAFTESFFTPEVVMKSDASLVTLGFSPRTDVTFSAAYVNGHELTLSGSGLLEYGYLLPTASTRCRAR